MSLLKDAVTALRSGDLKTAEHRCRQVLGQTPKNADALNLLGIVAGRVGKHDAAAELMQASVAIAPNKAPLRSNLATALLTLDRNEEAEKTLIEGLTHSPNDPNLLRLLGTAVGKLGRIPEAIELMERVMDGGSTDAVSHFNCLLYTSPSPRDGLLSRMPSSA